MTVRIRRRTYALGLVLLTGQLAACSAARCQYKDPLLMGPRASEASLPKRLAIAGWSQGARSDGQKSAAQAKDPLVGDVLARVAADFIKLRRNYLVYDTVAVHRSFAEACQGKVEGVLLVRALEAGMPDRGEVHLNLSAELYRCGDGALVWRVEGAARSQSQVADLAQLTDNYVSALGEPSRPYVAPAFSLLQDLFGELPDVTLSNDEVEEKIELGCSPLSLPALAMTHAL